MTRVSASEWKPVHVTSSQLPLLLQYKDIPVILGPGGTAVYAIDGHHTLAALDFSAHHDVEVTLTLVRDYHSYSVDKFWKTIGDDGFGEHGLQPYCKPLSYSVRLPLQ
jgi:hypothetical protein